MRKYQNSNCKRGRLHKFIILGQDADGLLERCERCGLKKKFKYSAPNHHYLSYHIRQALQVNDPLYYKEYPPNL